MSEQRALVRLCGCLWKFAVILCHMISTLFTWQRKVFHFYNWVLRPVNWRTISLILRRVNRKVGWKQEIPISQDTPEHPQAKLSLLSHVTQARWWDDERFRALKISVLNQLATGDAHTFYAGLPERLLFAHAGPGQVMGPSLIQARSCTCKFQWLFQVPADNFQGLLVKTISCKCLRGSATFTS